jgi:hypothetical protein
VATDLYPIKPANTTNEAAPIFKGALVVRVESDGPAAAANLERGDVIVAIDNIQLKLGSEVPAVVASRAIGTTLILTILRGGRQIEIPVKLGQRPSTRSGDSELEAKVHNACLLPPMAGGPKIKESKRKPTGSAQSLFDKRQQTKMARSLAS